MKTWSLLGAATAPFWVVAALSAAACDRPNDGANAAVASAATETVTAARATAAPAPPKPIEPWLIRTLKSSDPKFDGWIARAKELRLQILLTEVDPDQGKWITHEFRVDDEYFYPASAIKTFIAVAALRETSKKAGGDIHLRSVIRRCRIGKRGCKPPKPDEDDEDENGEKIDKDDERPRKHQKLYLGKEVRKLLSYSDNYSFNRLFDILGHERSNTIMPEIGFKSVRFNHKMNIKADRSRLTPRTLLLVPGKKAQVTPLLKSKFVVPKTAANGLLIGKGYNSGRKLVEEPLDFGTKNFVSLRDLHLMNISLLKPDSKMAIGLGISKKLRDHVIGAMTVNLRHEKHAAEHGPLSPGVLEEVPAKHARYVAKSGRAYGFHLENAFIEDTRTHRGFFITAVIYVNPNGILNDDDYAYDEESRPFLAALGKALAKPLLTGPGSDKPTTAEKK